MVKHLSTLAVQAIRLHQIMAVPIVRLQHGFVPEQSIRDLKEKMKEFQQVIAEMEQETIARLKLTND